VAYQEYWSLDEAIWLHRYEPELDNVRVALEWATLNDPNSPLPCSDRLGPCSSRPTCKPKPVPAIRRCSRFCPMFCREPASADFGKRSPPTTRRGNAIALATRRNSRLRCTPNGRHSLSLLRTHAAGGQLARRYRLCPLDVRSRSAPGGSGMACAPAGVRFPDRRRLLTSAGRFDEARAAYQRAVKLALTTSERQALVASVNIVELDLACGDTAAALQLGARWRSACSTWAARNAVRTTQQHVQRAANRRRDS
jgi:hypothetical protein